MEGNSTNLNPYSNVGPMAPTPPTPPNVKEVNSKLNFLKSKMLIFIGIITILILLSGAYILGKNNSAKPIVKNEITSPSPTTSPTADWEKYEGNGYYFKYPNYLKVIKDPRIRDESYINKICLDAEDSNYFFCLDSTNSTEPLDKIAGTQTSFIKIDGEKALQDLNPVAGQAGTDYQINIFFNHNDIGYKIYLLDNNSEDQGKELKNISNKILSTFKFTGSDSQSIDTSDWKTYNDPNNVFELKRPADWTQIQEESNGLQIVSFYPNGYKFDAPGIPAKDTPYLRITVIPEITGRGVNPLKIKYITIGGKSYKKFYETDTNGVIETIETPNGKGVMINFLLPVGTNNKNVDSEFDQILSSLKFN